MPDFDGRDRAKELEDVQIDTFDDYQAATARTAVYPGQSGFIGMVYATLGVGGEAGEVSEQVKKTWRDDGADIQAAINAAVVKTKARVIEWQREDDPPDHIDVIFDELGKEISIAFNPPLTPERRAKLIKEMGDTLWYISQLATEIDADLVGIAQSNINKLRARWREDLIHGEGSDREEQPATTTHTRPDPFGGPDRG